MKTLEKIKKEFLRRRTGNTGACIFYVQVAFAIFAEDGFLRDTEEDLEHHKRVMKWLFNERMRFTEDYLNLHKASGEIGIISFSWPRKVSKDEKADNKTVEKSDSDNKALEKHMAEVRRKMGERKTGINMSKLAQASSLQAHF